MRLARRHLALGAGMLAATTVGVFAGPLARPAMQHSIAASAVGPQCFPKQLPAGVLPTLPVVDADVTPSFTLYVKQGATTAGGARTYCYVTTPNGDVTYVEAPTIHIRRGGTFTLTLRNMIPPSGPSPAPTPQSTIIDTPDKCAWLPDDGATFPTPNPRATPGGYYAHARVLSAPDPPWMLPNDTNLHTHGWHVDPYVDNVYKSLVWAPQPNVCVFTFKVPLSQPPGTYWYHAHLHGLSDAQVGGGLGGALVVDPESPAPAVAETILLVKNSPYGQGPQISAAMHGMAASPMMGRPAPAAHYALLASRRGAEPSPCAASTAVPYPAFSPGPWCSGIAWPTSAPTPGYCPPPAANPSDVKDPLTVNGARVPAVIQGNPVPVVGPVVMQVVNTVRRYSIVNAISDSFLNVETVTDNGQRVPLVVVARDGVPVNWNFETARVDPAKPGSVVVSNVFVPPSGRVDIDVRMGPQPLTIASAAGTPTFVSASNTPYCIGYFGFGTQPQRNILRLKPFYGPAGAAHALAATAPAVQQHTMRTTAAQLVADDLPKVTRSRAVTFTMYPNEWNVTLTGDYPGANPPSSVKALPFTERPFWLVPGSNPVDPKYPYVPWITVHQNDVEEWSLYNATGEIHAFHIHQLTFVALVSPFEATNPYQQVFLDSIALPAAKLTTTPQPGTYPLLTPSLTKILIDFRRVDPGVFVFHCHMLFHEDHGMMGVIEVLPAITHAAKPG